jgi:hypothetical protein
MRSNIFSRLIKNDNPDLRITGLRAARELNADVIGVSKAIVNDPDAQVRRECAIALHHSKSDEAPALWLHLQHNMMVKIVGTWKHWVSVPTSNGMHISKLTLKK